MNLTPLSLSLRISHQLEQLNSPKTPRMKPQERFKTIDTVDIRILFTGHKPHPNERKSIHFLVGKFVTSIEDCTHLIAESVSPTTIFLCAISRAKLIVLPYWLDMSIKEGVFLDEAPFVLLDKFNEDIFGFKLSESICKAKAVKLLTEYTFAITPSVYPNVYALKSIIFAGSGKDIGQFPSKQFIAQNVKSLDVNFLKAHLPPAFSISPETFNIYTPDLVF
ncbi:PAX-interacting protein 1 [Massospora cicadina]|nr:PAX-interacting protein 1 [Massospora cicadina]